MAAHPFFLNSYIEIDRETLRNNARYLHRNLDSGVKSVAVVKADAYGHGAVDVARTLEDLYDIYAVDKVGEAIALRKAGITHPLLVFGVPVPQTVKAYKEYDLVAVVSSEEHFELLEPGTSYHVEIDSGMGRLGLSPDRLEQIRKKIDSADSIFCEGVMTHFATADERDSKHMRHQKKILREICLVFGGSIPVHAANSAASLHHPDTHVDMVRHGIALYGYDPGPEPSGGLSPVMKWKSRIVQCKYIGKSQTISYGATWKAPDDGYYAVIPTGYADGYRRSLSGKMPVLVEGNWYPQVGRVTMDYLMIWLGKDCYPAGKEALVMGGERNHAGLWAGAIGTIPYEICCGIHPKVPRKLV